MEHTVGEMKLVKVVGELRLVQGDRELSLAIFRQDVFDYCARLGEDWAAIGNERRRAQRVKGFSSGGARIVTGSRVYRTRS